LGKAKAFEKSYDWLKAVDFYEQVFGMTGEKDFLKKGEIQEKIGACFQRASFQAGSQEEFKEKMRRAIEAYEKAYGLYEKLEDEQKDARMLRCSAIVKLLSYWLTSVPSEKRKFLDECLELGGKALLMFLESGDMLEYGRTYNELASAFFARKVLEWNWQICKSIIEQGLEWGEKAVALLTKLGDSHETAMANLNLGFCLCIFWYSIAEPEKQDKNRLKAIEHLHNAVELSERVGDDYVIGLSNLWLGFCTGGEESVRHFEKTVECGEKTRDSFLKGMGLDLLAYATYWKAIATENPDQRRELAEKAMEFYDKAEHYYSTICYQNPRGGLMASPGGYVEHYNHLAMWETDPEKRRKFLEKSEEAGVKALQLAEASDLPHVIYDVFHVVSKSLHARALMELDSAEKRNQLEKALKYREKAIEIADQQTPSDYWDRGVMQNYLAEIKAELAEIEPNVDIKRRLLEEVASSKEKCLELCNKGMAFFERMGRIDLFAALQAYQDTYATILTRLYDFTRDEKYLRKTIEISQKAIESASKLEMTSPIAESYWKIAKTQDILGEHLEATRNFERASESYLKAAEKIQQLNTFYQDYASYMEAWSEIEKAKHHHTQEKYGQAKEHYEKAANLHKSTERWNHLSPNYLAWARLEEAEDLSRREQTEEAKDLFQQTVNLFADAKKSIQTALEKIESKNEKETLINLTKASDVRLEYCLGRIALEEAKILDRQGNHVTSSRRYGSAAEKFQKAADIMEDEMDRQELKPIIYLCQAWQMMTHAEAETSPELYKEASKLFEEAKNHSLDEKAKMLALGHSRFCKALEAGTRFEDTRDTSLHASATQHLESAASYYLKAGFKDAAEYAEATQKLLDAYLYMHNAKTETDPDKKTRLYTMAEKVLQTSAGSYLKAKHPEKQEQVSRLLEKVKKERELALSLTDILHAPLATSTTATFTTPSQTEEKPTGLERFEHADIQANLIIKVKEVRVGEDVNLEIEMVNAGKAPAQLVKVEEIVPIHFEIKEAPQVYKVEDSYLNLKGKRLDPLKTEEVKIVVKPLSKGMFLVKPRILYLDETGKYKSHEPEPIPITVKELGIKGWIKGEK